MSDEKTGHFELKADETPKQERLPLKDAPPKPANGDKPARRKKDSARLVWDSKPKRPPSPRDIEFQTAEVVIPNPARDASALPYSFRDGILDNEQIDKVAMNRLIWGDNLLAMQALLANGYEGKIDLIYIDPPFDSDADYSYKLTIGQYEVEKQPSVFERIAYTDTWEAGTDSYLDTIFPCLHLMRRLLSDSGSLFCHIGPNISHYVRCVLDEVFGLANFRNEIVLPGRAAKNLQQQFDTLARLNVRHDVLYWYSKRDDARFAPHWIEKHNKGNPQGHWHHFWSTADRPTMRYELFGVTPPSGQWVWKESVALDAVENHERFQREAGGRNLAEYWRDTGKKLRFIRKSPDDGSPQYWRAPSETRLADTMWAGIPIYSSSTNFPTEKSEEFLEEVISLGSNEGGIVADFYSGSGTTLAVAEKLGRRWIGCDFGKVGIQVTRARLVEQDAKPFLIENIGNYQRHMIYLTGGRIGEMQRIILKLYGATPHPHHNDLGTRQAEDGVTELVYVGYPDRPTTARKVIDLAKQAESLDGSGYKRLVVLAWDYDYNFDAEYEAQLRAARHKPKAEVKRLLIPPDVYDYLKKAKDDADIEKLAEKILFHEKPYLKIKSEISNLKSDTAEVILSLDKYVLFDLPVPEKQREKLREAIADNFAILIDYWAVDWDYDGATFRSQWQAIRGNGKRAKVVPTQTSHTLKTGSSCTIAVRVVDVFGNDAAATVTINL